MSNIRTLFMLTLIVFCFSSSTLRGQSEAVAETQQAPTTSGEQPPAPVVDPEVKAVVEKGIEHVNAKEFQQAVQAFTAAAKRYPKNNQLRHLLGFALYQNQQAGPAWLQFRSSVRLNPTYGPAVRDFLAMWNVFDQKGVLNIGRSMEEMTKYLGNPDRKLGNETKQVWEYGFMRLHFNEGRLFAVIDPRGLDPVKSRPVDAMKVEFDDNDRWRLGYRAINRLASQTEYIPKDQSVQQWNELFTVQRLYAQVGKKTPKAMMKEIEVNLKKMNPNIDFKALLDTEEDVLFHWRDKGDTSAKRPAQHEIVRLVAGQKDIHRLAYARRVAQIPTEDAQTWIGLLRQAELKKTTATAEVTPQE